MQVDGIAPAQNVLQTETEHAANWLERGDTFARLMEETSRLLRDIQEMGCTCSTGSANTATHQLSSSLDLFNYLISR